MILNHFLQNYLRVIISVNNLNIDDCKILLVGNQLSLAINFAGTLEWVNELTWSENKSLGKQQLKMVNEGVEK